MLVVTAFKTPAGWLEVQYDEHYVYRAQFTKIPAPNQGQTEITKLLEQELEKYSKNPHHHFQLPLKPQGTAYQHRVWQALLAIPVGRTVSYGELANTLQSGPRAIGQACKSNRIALFIPCHRVVGKNDLGGFMGKTNSLCFKTDLLAHEGNTGNNQLKE